MQRAPELKPQHQMLSTHLTWAVEDTDGIFAEG